MKHPAAQQIEYEIALRQGRTPVVAIQLMDSLASCSAFRRQDMGVRKPHWTQLGSERIVGEPLVDIRIEPLHVREHSVGDFAMEADDDCVRGDRKSVV